jgi:5,10-methenyltetrahydrofolate synthetase
MSNPTPLTKPQLRQECKRIRSKIDEDTRRKTSLAICRQIESWHTFQKADTVLTYMAMGSEVNLSPLLAYHPNLNWAIPRIQAGGQMQFHSYDPEKLVHHSFGMLEPHPGCPIIPSEAIQLTLVPGLAFDPNGWRLGYGGGFYDRFLSNFQGVTAGITYQALCYDAIPHAVHDIPMQYVITETGIKDVSAES